MKGDGERVGLSVFKVKPELLALAVSCAINSDGSSA
jgi:hypothetical protein